MNQRAWPVGAAFVACGVVFIIIDLWVIGLCEIVIGLTLASGPARRH